MANAGAHNVEVIDIETLASNIESGLSADLAISPLCSIFRIPTILSRHNIEAYKPNAFSFGPFHHENEKLKPTNKIKQKYLFDLICRLSKPKENPIVSNPIKILPDSKLIRNFTKAISDVHNEVLEYYAGPTGMEADKFIEMLVLDGCFIIELFRKKPYSHTKDLEDDPIFTMSCLLQFLYHDLILLENQIPWLVLDILFEMTKTTSIEEKPLVQLAIDFFCTTFSPKPIPIEPLLSTKSKHILDLLRNSLILNSSMKQNNLAWKRMPPATKLKDSGIKFDANSSANSILDITFQSKTGVMAIPTLIIQETTETLFRNLISLEQCCPKYEPIITSYAVLLDNLIDTNNDIQILDKKKAIINWLNVDDATKLFNKLYIDALVNENYYQPLTNEVKTYLRSRWPKYRRVLKRDYFKHPWALISVIAASIALILTFLQTLFGIIK